MEPLIRGASLRGFGPLVEELGGDPEAYLARFGLPSALLTTEDVLIPITAHDLMLEAAARDLDCPDFGLRLAGRQGLDILGPLAVAIQASSTVGQAFECASRFLFAHCPALSIDVVPDPRGSRGVVAVVYRKDLTESPYSAQAVELALGIAVRAAQTFISDLPGLRSVELSHRPIANEEVYRDFFGVGVRFGAGWAGFRIDQTSLALPLENGNEMLRSVAVEYLTQSVVDPRRQAAAQVRRVLLNNLGTATPSVGDVARLLAMHPRTLQRRLAAESTSFDQVLDSTRRDLALRYLTTTDLPVAQVAAMAGFAAQSGLSHAVRRWYDETPTGLRRRFRGDDAILSS